MLIFDVAYREQASTDQNIHTFVLKTYNTPDAERYYKNEVDGFWNLSRRGGRNPNIIGFYGSFVRNGTFNVLLEYADRGTLAQYFDTVPPPSSGEDILKFWHELSKTLGALTAIHSVQPHDSATSAASPILQGYRTAFTLHGDFAYISRWHQDLKPSNLLVQSKRRGSPGDCEIKIADLGLSHFKKHVPSQGEATDKDAYGTRAYGRLRSQNPSDLTVVDGSLGAPECYRADSDIERVPILVNQSVDIWSLGAILSAAAVWVVHGKGGLSEYSRRRREETARIHGFRDGDCFHDGERVLDTVTKIHRNLADDIRSSDHVTGAMVHMVTEEMLIESQSRTSAKSLSYRTKRILEDAEAKLRKPTTYADTSSLSGNKVRSPPRTPPEPPPGHDPYSSRKSQSQRLPSRTYTGSLMNASYNGDEGHHQELTDDFFGKGPHQQAHFSKWPIPRPSPGPVNLSYEDQDRISETHLNREFSGHGHLQDNPFSSTWHEPHFPYRRPRRIPSGFVPGAETRNGINTSSQNVGEINDDSAQFTAAPRGVSRSSTSTPVHNPLHSSRVGQHSPNITSRTRPPRLDFHNVPLPVTDQESRRPSYLSVIHAQQWKSDRKQHRPAKLPHGDHIADLKDRDHVSRRLADCSQINRYSQVFLIDNSSSMGSNRKEVYDLLGLLAYIVKRTDPDGIEMRFTMSPERRDKARDTGPLLRTLETAPFSGESNIRTQVGEIFQDYHAKLRDQKHTRSLFGIVRSPRPIRRQNVYIFTDGVWQPNCDPTDLIENLVKGLEQNSMNREQFGIQFIRFGNDLEGTKRLKHLDSGLGLNMYALYPLSIRGMALTMAQGYCRYGAFQWKRLEDASRRNQQLV